MNSEQAVRNVAFIRLVVGVGAYLFPRLAGRLFGLDSVGNPQSPYLARLFGIRDIALAIGALQTSGEAQRTWVQVGVLCDVADTGAALMGQRAGYLTTPTAVMVAIPAVTATALGVQGLQAPSSSA
jgi:hypothetical protein